MKTVQAIMVWAVLGAWCGAVLGADNDAFKDAKPLSGLPVQVTGDNYNCSPEAGEPDHYSGCAATNSVWWTWTAPAPGRVTIHVLGSDFDTVLAVYTGATLATLAPVANSDDYGGSVQSLVTFDALGGVQYRIAVDGAVGAQGVVRLTLCGGGTPASNRTFAARAALGGMTAEWMGNNSNAVAEAEAPPVAGVEPIAPLWWNWTAPKSCVMDADTRGSGIDTILGVYTGEALGVLAEVASNNDRGTNKAGRVWWDATAGVTYQIMVDGRNGAWGGIRLKLGEVERPVIGGVSAGKVRWNSLAGEDYRVMRSTNLYDWASATSLVATAGETIVNLSGESAPRAFYRVSRYLP